MFYFGYLAAKADIHVVDVSRISDNTAKVMQLCKAEPGMMVPQAFRQALRPCPPRRLIAGTGATYLTSGLRSPAAPRAPRRA